MFFKQYPAMSPFFVFLYITLFTSKEKLSEKLQLMKWNEFNLKSPLPINRRKKLEHNEIFFRTKSNQNKYEAELQMKSLMDIENFFISLLHSKYVYEVIWPYSVIQAKNNFLHTLLINAYLMFIKFLFLIYLLIDSNSSINKCNYWLNS